MDIEDNGKLETCKPYTVSQSERNTIDQIVKD